MAMHHGTIVSILRCRDNLPYIKQIWPLLKEFHYLTMTTHALDHGWDEHIKELYIKPSDLAGYTTTIEKYGFSIDTEGIYGDAIMSRSGQSYPVVRYAKTLDAIEAIDPNWRTMVLSTLGAGFNEVTCAHEILAINQPSCIPEIEFTPDSWVNAAKRAVNSPEILRQLQKVVTPEILPFCAEFLTGVNDDDNKEVALYL